MSPQAGHEQAGHRPAFVLSPKEFNVRTGFAIVCPMTKIQKSYPFEVPILNVAGHVTGVVLADQVKSLDWRARNARFKELAGEDTVTRVKEFLAKILDF